MDVEQLCELLYTMDPDAKVVIRIPSRNGNITIYDISTVLRGVYTDRDEFHRANVANGGEDNAACIYPSIKGL